MNLQILFRDQSLMICEKPVGISSESPGMPEFVREQTGQTVYPVHRLDKTTGGVMLLACSPLACEKAQALFQRDQVRKEYLAVISGVPEAESGTFRDLLYHDQKSNKTFPVKKMRKGVKEASCDWSLLQTEETAQGPMTLVKVSLHTGRTHQIRVQFASRKFPLIGDRRYGSRIRSDAPALWASYISFPHPLNGGEEIEAWSAPPSVFPWNLFSCLTAPEDPSAHEPL